MIESFEGDTVTFNRRDDTAGKSREGFGHWLPLWAQEKQHFNYAKTKSRYFFRSVLWERDAFRLWWPKTMAPTGNSQGPGSNVCSARLRVIRAVRVYLGSGPHSQPFSTSCWVRKGQSDTVPPLQKTVWTFNFHARSKVGTTALATQWNTPSLITPATSISTATTQHPQRLQCMCQI